MLVVVSELLPAHGANDVTGARLWLLNELGPLFGRSQLLGLLVQVFQILLVQEALVLISEFALFLQLKDTRAQRRLDVEVRNVVLAHVDAWAEVHFEGLNLRRRVTREKVALVCILVLVVLPTDRRHVSGEGAGPEARHAE